MVVVSDLHLAPVATEVSRTRCRRAGRNAGRLQRARDAGASPATGSKCWPRRPTWPGSWIPILSSPTRSSGSRPRGHHVVVVVGNYDGQLAWDAFSVSVLRERLGVTDVTLACDLAIMTGNGSQLVRVTTATGWISTTPSMTPGPRSTRRWGHHVVRQVLPALASRDQPGLAAGGRPVVQRGSVRFVGSRLLYRMVAGWLWWLAVPFAAALVLRFLSFAPGIKPLLSHHAERWLIVFGILVVAIALIAMATGIATMLRVNRALAMPRSASAGTRGAQRGRPGRGGPADLRGIRGHGDRPHPRTRNRPDRAGVLRQHRLRDRGGPAWKARFGLPAPFLAVRRLSMVELRAGQVLSVSLSLAERPSASLSLPRAAGPRAGTGPAPEARGRRPAAGRRDLAGRRAGADAVGAPPPGPPGGRAGAADQRTPQRRLRAGVAAAVAPHGRAWLPFSIHPVSGVTAVIGGLALIGVARGVRHGYRRAWVTALVILLVSIVYRLTQECGPGRPARRLLFGLWLLVEARHFRGSPPRLRRVLGWFIMSLLAVAALGGRAGRRFRQRPRHPRCHRGRHLRHRAPHPGHRAARPGAPADRTSPGGGLRARPGPSSTETAATRWTTLPGATTRPGCSPGTR